MPPLQLRVTTSRSLLPLGVVLEADANAAGIEARTEGTARSPPSSSSSAHLLDAPRGRSASRCGEADSSGAAAAAVTNASSTTTTFSSMNSVYPSSASSSFVLATGDGAAAVDGAVAAARAFTEAGPAQLRRTASLSPPPRAPRCRWLGPTGIDARTEGASSSSHFADGRWCERGGGGESGTLLLNPPHRSPPQLRRGAAEEEAAAATSNSNSPPPPRAAPNLAGIDARVVGASPSFDEKPPSLPCERGCCGDAESCGSLSARLGADHVRTIASEMLSYDCARRLQSVGTTVVDALGDEEEAAARDVATARAVGVPLRRYRPSVASTSSFVFGAGETKEECGDCAARAARSGDSYADAGAAAYAEVTSARTSRAGIGTTGASRSFVAAALRSRRSAIAACSRSISPRFARMSASRRRRRSSYSVAALPDGGAVVVVVPALLPPIAVPASARRFSSINARRSARRCS